jgi:hypothetical protein
MIVYDWVTQYLALTGSGRIANSWQCPAHDDASPSLAVNEAANGTLLIHCHAGCSYGEVVDALSLPRWIYRMAPARGPAEWLAGVEHRPSYPPMTSSSASGGWAPCQEKSVEHHMYVRDQVRLERVRCTDGRKRIRWERRVGKHWEYLRGDIRLTDLPLYRQDYLKQARALGEPVVLCESESSVDGLIDAGIYATTWAGGASSPNIPRLRRTLAGLTVVWIPDNDAAGRKCSDIIQFELADVTTLHILWPPTGEDARDLLRHRGAEGLRRLIDEAVASPAERTQPPIQADKGLELTHEDWDAINTLRRALMKPAIPPDRWPHQHPRRPRGDVRTDEVARVVAVIRDARPTNAPVTGELAADWLTSEDIAALSDYTSAVIRSVARHLSGVPTLRLPRAMAVFLADIPPSQAA